jgi:hypothetical protein
MDHANLQQELNTATEFRKAAGAGLAAMRARAAAAKKALRRSKEYKAWKGLEADVKLNEASYARACETVFGVVDEIRNSGRPNLPLFGRPNGKPAVEPMSAGVDASAPAQQPDRRKPGRPRAEAAAAEKGAGA